MLNVDNVEYGHDECWIWTWWMLNVDMMNVEYGQCVVWTYVDKIIFLSFIIHSNISFEILFDINYNDKL